MGGGGRCDCVHLWSRPRDAVESILQRALACLLAWAVAWLRGGHTDDMCDVGAALCIPRPASTRQSRAATVLLRIQDVGAV